MSHQITYMIDLAAQLLIGNNRSNPDTKRWLVFEFEASNPGGPTFRWRARYLASGSVVGWQIVVGSVPHVNPNGRYAGQAAWVPAEDYSETPMLSEFERADGYVIATGRHDSEWRHGAFHLYGHPYVPMNYYKSGDGRDYINSERTVWFRVTRETKVWLRRVSISGPGGTDYEGNTISFPDGEVNFSNEDCNPNNAQWDVLYALSKLAHTAGLEELAICLDARYSTPKYRREDGQRVVYVLRDGLAVRRAHPDFGKAMELKDIAQPYRLTEETFEADSGVLAKRSKIWTRTHLFPDSQPWWLNSDKE